MVEGFEDLEDLLSLVFGEEEGEGGGEVVLVLFDDWLWGVGHCVCSVCTCVYAQGLVRSLKAA